MMIKPAFDKYVKDGDVTDLVSAYKKYMDTNNNGFIAKLADVLGVSKISDIPKEFPEFEYEVKFDITPLAVVGKKEPTIVQYLDAFDFPPTNSARFLKDPVNDNMEGINMFFGDDLDERIVVIHKAGKHYLKEKGKVMPVDHKIPYEGIVIKRTEERYEASVEDITDKIAELTRDAETKYRGKIRKEKGDAFILDLNDGRIYSFTITRAHLVKPGEFEESAVQRQLELEYAGFLPGFPGFKKDSEPQIVTGMVDLAKRVYTLYDGSPVANGWRMKLAVTSERKYDFIVNGNGDRKKKLAKKEVIELPMPSIDEVRAMLTRE
jgi:hypothetical protein